MALLTPSGASDQVAVFHIEIPADGGMPEHAHGPSEIVLIPLAGTIELLHNGQSRTLLPGMAAHIGVGERVSVANPGTETASVMAVAGPPDFTDNLAAWPTA